MNPLRTLDHFVRPLLRLRKLNEEISEEVRTHLELAAEAYVAKGLSPDEARRRAERDFGRFEVATELYRDARGVSWVSGWWQDLRYTVRSLARARMFTIVAVLTLALGIGSAAAIFSLVDWVLFRSIDYPADVVTVGGTNKSGQFHNGRLSIQIQAYREQAESLTDFALERPFDINVAVDGETVTHGVMAVSPNLLPMLRAEPVLGRSFADDETMWAQPFPVIITHKCWRGYFNGSPDVLGRKVVLDGQGVGSVVGVLAADQMLPPNLRSDVFIPLPPATKFEGIGDWHGVFARVKPGVTLAQVNADLGRINVPLPDYVLAYNPHINPHVVTLAEFGAAENRQMYWILVGAVGFLYAIACLNATNLMVVRIIGRRRELSIRLALGGGHARVVRLLVIEGALLAFAASSAGVMVANWLMPLLRIGLDPSAGFHWARWSIDARALAVLVGITAITAAIIVVVPGMRILRHDLLEGLRDGGVTVGDAPALARLRRTIVVLQAAFAVVLLTGAGLMVQTLTRLQRVTFGFDATRLIKVQLAFPPGFASSPEKGMQRLEELRGKLGKVPGVVSVAFGSDTLVTGKYNDGVKVTTGKEPPVAAEMHMISENFLGTSGMKLLRGSMGERWGQGVLINERFARAMFGENDPIGQIMRPVQGGETKHSWMVVGIVNDVREMARSTPRNHIYASAEWAVPQASTWIVRAARQPDTDLAGLVRRAIYQYEPRMVIAYVAPLPEAIGWQTNTEKLVLSTLKVLSGVALALTVVGLFSLLTYTVDQRMTEFGLRQVLGATRPDLIALVLRASMSLIVVGVGAGLLGAVALSRSLRSLLFETPPYDPLVLGSVAALLILSGLMAAILPAARAARTDVARLLRAE